MMEDLPASDDDAIDASMKLVDEADIYVGVFAYRYGYVPEGHKKSITEMEYERAVERQIPRLIFLISDSHLVTGTDVETGEGAAKLGALKERLKKEQVVNFFNSPDALLAYSLDSLNGVVDKLRAEAAKEDDGPAADPIVASLIPVSDIPAPPEPFIAHPYTLLETHKLIGRQQELELLTDWVARPEKVEHARVMTFVAVSGMGNSALTWKWFNDVAPQEMTPLAGRIWWSFYEAGSGFENFVTRTLAYVSGQTVEQVAKAPLPEQEQQLLALLDQQPYVVVLDGLERILIAYARMDAAFLQDGDLDDEASNYVAGAHGLPASAGQSFVGRHHLRKTVDPHVGQFLRRLTGLQASRILISSRLYPAELQAPLGDPLPRCSARFLPGHDAGDALDLWRAYGARGSREVMLPVFRAFGSHPLLIQLLAYEVVNFRDDPGNFDAWRTAHPDFDPFDLPLVKVQTHVLEVALRGLSSAEARTLHIVAGFRTPVSMETLKALLIRTAADDDALKVPYASLGELDAGLTDLEDRGLLGWDRRSNRYDLHPIVRGVTWHCLDEGEKKDVYGTLRRHFELMPKIDDWRKTTSLDDLQPAVELYYTLIGLKQNDDGYRVFQAQLNEATLWRLSANRQRVAMLECLLPNGLDNLPRLSSDGAQGWVLNELASALSLSGTPHAALSLNKRVGEVAKSLEDRRNLSMSYANLSRDLRHVGALHEAESLGRSALQTAGALDAPFAATPS